MPNRIIKESICTSENLDQLSAFQETVFYRLLVNCDDYGRMDARPKILAARLFPLKDIRAAQMEEALRALTSAELVTLYEVGGKPFLQMKTWERHQQIRAKKSKYPSAKESTCNHMISDDIKCPRNPIQSESNPNPNRNPNARAREDDDDARRIAEDHNRVLDAAEDAGFQKSNSVRGKLIDLYAEYGLEKVLAGIDSCVQHGAPNLAYLEAVLKGGPKKPDKPKAPKSAQDYQQRDYSGEQDSALERMLEWGRKYEEEKRGPVSAGA